jgi:hypothetical protein
MPTGIIPPEFLVEVSYRSFSVDQKELYVCYLSEVFQVLDRETRTERGVMCAAG